jgi:hypothetical protein
MVYNLFLWVRGNPDRDFDGLIEKIDQLSVDSDGIKRAKPSHLNIFDIITPDAFLL